MRGDFSRLELAGDGSSRVLMQQGRVLLDSDWNELMATVVAAQRRLAADLIGAHGGPTDDLGFTITGTVDKGDPDLDIGAGTYYVDGIRVNLDADPAGNSGATLWSQQPFPPQLDPYTLPDPPYLVYLDVWERHMSSVQDDTMREVALGGPDTSSRARVVWQARVASLAADADADLQTTCPNFPLDNWRKRLLGNPPLLRAWAGQPPEDDSPCLAAPDARYRGVENQLYRVEVAGVDADGATFVWSRENGSVVASWTATDGNDLHVDGVRDAVRGFASGDWVELTWDELDLAALPGTRVQVLAVDGPVVTIDPATATGAVHADPASLAHPVVRRWDARQRTGIAMVGGAIRITEADDDTNRVPLEDGIVVQFALPAQDADAHRYRVGDYWTIPARVATGDILWPRAADGTPLALAPQGIRHHYAPLGWQAAGGFTDLRHRFARLARCARA